MYLTHFCPKRREIVGNKNNSPVNIRFVAKTSDIRNVSENIRSDVKTSEVATLHGMLCRSGTGSGVAESTPAGLCVFHSDQESKI